MKNTVAGFVILLTAFAVVLYATGNITLAFLVMIVTLVCLPASIDPAVLMKVRREEPEPDTRIDSSFDEETGIVTFKGPPITDEMQLIFGHYCGQIEGLIPLAHGIRVTYVAGPTLLFIPVPEDASVIITPDGDQKVV